MYNTQRRTNLAFDDPTTLKSFWEEDRYIAFNSSKFNQNVIGRLKQLSCSDPPVSFAQISPQNCSETNYYKLPSHDVLFDIVVNYLEIGEIFRMVNCCKFVYGCLFGDADKFWKRIAKRDGFIRNDDFNTSGEECSKMYRNLWCSCLEFESKSNSSFVESHTYSTLSYSNNPDLFKLFQMRINDNFNQMMCVVRNTKRKHLLRAYIVAFGLNKISRVSSLIAIRKENIEIMFDTLCKIEDGFSFQVGLDFQKTITCNMLGLMFEVFFKGWTDESKLRIENSFLKNAAFRIDCSNTSTESFNDRAIKIIERRYNEKSDMNQFYECFTRLLRCSTVRLQKSSELTLIVMSLLSCTCRKTETIELLVELLRNNEIFDKCPIYESVCKGLILVHPKLFEELMHEKFYSGQCKEDYFTKLGDYILSKEASIDLSIRERALLRLIQISKETTTPYGGTPYYKIWSNLKDNEEYSWKEFKERALHELEESIFCAWRKSKTITDGQMITDMATLDCKRTVDQLLELKPLPMDPYTPRSTVDIVFNILMEYAKSLAPENSKEYSKLVDFLSMYCVHAVYNDNYNIQVMYRYLTENYPHGVFPIFQAMQLVENRNKQQKSSIK